jgi:hypothetical protein
VKRVLLVLAAAAAAGGCRTEQIGPGGGVVKNPPISDSTRNEREAEEIVRQALQCYADWNLEGAYKLICRSDRAKVKWEQFKAESEKNREALIQAARKSQVISSGETTLPDGSPYVTVVVRVDPNEVVPYSVVREAEGWRLIMVDIRRARQAKE